MPTPAAIIDMAASLMNDTAQTVYTDAACLPYLNMALAQLQEEMEMNNIPNTNETSALINLVAGTAAVGFLTTPPLPVGLIEIQRLWESPEGQNQWIPMTRKDFLPHYLQDVRTPQFIFWAWIGEQIRLLPANQDNDIKLDYVGRLYALPIAIGAINTDLPVINSLSYLGYKTAALCAMFIGENPTRAAALEGEAYVALSRTLGISNKGRQAITTRRRPFRSAFKHFGW